MDFSYDVAKILLASPNNHYDNTTSAITTITTNTHFGIANVLLVIAMTILSVLTTFGNLIVILCFILYKNVRTYSNYYILSLSVADLLIGFFCIPFYSHSVINNGIWAFGTVFCRIWLVIDYVAGTASILQILIISMDRWLSVIYPIKYRKWSNLKFILINITLVWFVALMNYGPAVILWPLLNDKTTASRSSNDTSFILKLNESRTIMTFHHNNGKINENYECRADFRDNFYYLLIAASVEFFIPFFSISAFNFLIFLNIRRRNKTNSKSQRIPNTLYMKLNRQNSESIRDGSVSTKKKSITTEIFEYMNLKYKKLRKTNVLQNSIEISARLKSSETSNDCDCINGDDDDEQRQNSCDRQTMGESCFNEASNQKLYTDDLRFDNSRGGKEEEDVNFLLLPTNKTLDQLIVSSDISLKIFDIGKSANDISTSGGQISKSTTRTLTFKDDVKENVREQRQLDTNISALSTREPNFAIQHPDQLFLQLERRRQKYLERDKKIYRSLAILVIVFFICWFPYTLLALIEAICLNKKKFICVNPTVFELSFWLLWLNSTINPFLYPFVQPSFRNAYKSMFCQLLSCLKIKKLEK